jgi:hypothetical protein
MLSFSHVIIFIVIYIVVFGCLHNELAVHLLYYTKTNMFQLCCALTQLTIKIQPFYR